MTMLNELQKAIKQLSDDKKELFRKIEDECWKDDRYEKKIIPETTTLDALLQDGIDKVPEKRLLPSDFGRLYQHWYSAAKTIIDKNQPSRTEEFENIYLASKIKDSIGIKQLIAQRYITKDEQFKLMDMINSQFNILAAVESHLAFSIYDIELTAYSVLMDDEIKAANYLLRNGFIRPAGAMAGVILERHLKNLLRKHTPPIKYKEKDTLATLNELCKETIYDLVTWRKVAHLADIRNLCTHDKKREPTKNEVAELINGVSAMLKTYNQ
jgi:hypothetical protein